MVVGGARRSHNYGVAGFLRLRRRRRGIEIKIIAYYFMKLLYEEFTPQNIISYNVY